MKIIGDKRREEYGIVGEEEKKIGLIKMHMETEKLRCHLYQKQRKIVAKEQKRERGGIKERHTLNQILTWYKIG